MRKRRRGKSLLEVLYPDAPEELVRIAKTWVAGSSDVMLGSIWRAYDALLVSTAIKAALTTAHDDVERGITRLLYFELDNLLTGDEPFRLLAEAPEDEARKHPPARPPAYDIAFAMRVNPRIMWALEAKVLPTPATLADYVTTLKKRYLSGDYAPFVSEGAMVGYLLRGCSDEVFAAIAKQLGTRLSKPNQWKTRAHRISAHQRNIPPNKPYPKRFHCHHLILEFASAIADNTGTQA